MRNIGDSYAHERDYEKALEYYLVADGKLEKEMSPALVSSLWRGIAKGHLELDNPELALSYFRRALGISDQLRNPANVARVSLNLAKFYHQTQPDSALYYARVAQREARRSGNL